MHQRAECQGIHPEMLGLRCPPPRPPPWGLFPSSFFGLGVCLTPCLFFAAVLGDGFVMWSGGWVGLGRPGPYQARGGNGQGTGSLKIQFFRLFAFSSLIVPRGVGSSALQWLPTAEAEV